LELKALGDKPQFYYQRLTSQVNRSYYDSRREKKTTPPTPLVIRPKEPAARPADSLLRQLPIVLVRLIAEYAWESLRTILWEAVTFNHLPVYRLLRRDLLVSFTIPSSKDSHAKMLQSHIVGACAFFKDLPRIPMLLELLQERPDMTGPGVDLVARILTVAIKHKSKELIHALINQQHTSLVSDWFKANRNTLLPPQLDWIKRNFPMFYLLIS